MVELPLNMAMSQQRELSCPRGPEEVIVEQFRREWKSLRADSHIFNLGRLARI